MTLYTVAITLILVMDPLGNIPVFLSVLERFEPRRQIKIIFREVFIAFVILTIFLFFGRYIMHGLNLSTEALSVAGGLILFLIAIRMIFPPEKKESPEDDPEEPFIVPLAVPLTAGPSALAMVLLFATREPNHLFSLFAAVTVATIIFLAIMLCSPYLMRILGRRGLIAVERLMGMILTAVAVQMLLSGIVHFIQPH
jgi:multiple antibiotic resistance protein